MSCDGCQLTYEKLRTGLDFATVRQMMFVGTDDTTQWRHKHRRGVLGFWRGLKLQLWEMHVGQCRAAHEAQS